MRHATILMFSLVFVLLFPACHTAQKTAGDATPKAAEVIDPIMHFEQPFHDFGTIKKGEKPGFTYVFTNTSNEPLDIELVSGCYCTRIEWPEAHTFQPGEKGEIKIVYDSDLEEELGEHDKTIDILLERTDPKTGYQIIKEVKFHIVVTE